MRTRVGSLDPQMHIAANELQLRIAHQRARQQARLAQDLKSVADPEHHATATYAKEKFRRAFDNLPQRDREVAVLLYVKNLTLREIGEVMGVSESRICQIHSQLKRTLKQQLSDDSLLFSAVG